MPWAKTAALTATVTIPLAPPPLPDERPPPKLPPPNPGLRGLVSQGLKPVGVLKNNTKNANKTAPATFEFDLPYV